MYGRYDDTGRTGTGSKDSMLKAIDRVYLSFFVVENFLIMKNKLYADNAADYVSDRYNILKKGNPNSVHFAGRKNRKAIDIAKKKLAIYLKNSLHTIYFTPSASLSIYFAIKACSKGNIAYFATDHMCVIKSCESVARDLNKKAFALSMNKKGQINIDEIIKTIRNHNIKTIVASSVNSETGVLFDVDGLKKDLEDIGVKIIVDAVAELGKVHSSKMSNLCDVYVYSGYKIGGSIGASACVIKDKEDASSFINLTQYILGTPNYNAIESFANSIEDLREESIDYLNTLTKRFEDILLNRNDNIKVNFLNLEKAAGFSSIYFPGITSEDMVIMLDINDVAASVGSACAAKTYIGSRAIKEMGIPKNIAESSVRFSFSAEDTITKIEKIANIVAKVYSESVNQGKQVC